MALIEFKDKPNTTTPLNATNLNNNFNELVSKVVEGQEIALNEYVGGKQVYRLYKNLGVLPNNTGGSYLTGLSSNYTCIKYQLFAVKGKQILSIPFIDLNNTGYISSYLNDTSQLPAMANFDARKYNLYIDIYYVK